MICAKRIAHTFLVIEIILKIASITIDSLPLQGFSINKIMW